MKRLLVSLYLLFLSVIAYAQTPGVVNLSVTPTTANGTLTPLLTWSTSPTAISCVASGGWAGARAASGTVALAAITSTTDYTLTCSWSGGSGAAKLLWAPPTLNTDGSTLDNLSGFKALYGTAATGPFASIAFPDPAAISGTITGLSPGNYFFAIRAVNALGVESANGNVIQKAISGPLAVTASKTVTATVAKVPMPPSNLTVVEVAAYNVTPDYVHFAFVRGPRFGTAKIGAACDEARLTLDGYMAISRNSTVTPRPAQGVVLVARCG